jgi:hypothetical protein
VTELDWRILTIEGEHRSAIHSDIPHEPANALAQSNQYEAALAAFDTTAALEILATFVALGDPCTVTQMVTAGSIELSSPPPGRSSYWPFGQLHSIETNAGLSSTTFISPNCPQFGSTSRSDKFSSRQGKVILASSLPAHTTGTPHEKAKTPLSKRGLRASCEN